MILTYLMEFLTKEISCLIEIMSFYLYSPGTGGIEKLPYLDRMSIA